MQGEIIAIGDELTTGRILNSTSNFAAGHLFAAGHEVIAMATVGDDPEVIGKALIESLERVDFIIVTGGLGPTSDDRTAEAVAAALERPVQFYPEILGKIRARIRDSTGNTITDLETREKKVKSLEKMAWLPAGAEMLNPEASMAGFLLVHNQKPIFFLPGIPYEMKELMIGFVIPKLAGWQAEPASLVRQKTYKTFGLKETEINSKLKELEKLHGNKIRIGYYPVYPEVHVSLTVLGSEARETDILYSQLHSEVAGSLGNFIYGTDADTMEKVVGILLDDGGLTIAVAESCTGGMISEKITQVAGSSNYFLGGIVAYSNELKEKVLAVEAEILAAHGAVSAETAVAMVRGVKRLTGADVAVSVTGIAGPDGGTVEKPVGTVFFGVLIGEALTVLRCQFSGVRWQVQTMASHTALDIVRRQLLGV